MSATERLCSTVKNSCHKFSLFKSVKAGINLLYFPLLEFHPIELKKCIYPIKEISEKVNTFCRETHPKNG